MPDTTIPQLNTLCAVEFGTRVAVIGDERTIVAAIDAGKPVAVETETGTVKVVPGARWVKRNGAQRFNLRGETGHGPRGGRKRYQQSIAAFYTDSDVTPMPFEDGALLLTCEADSYDAPKTATGKPRKGQQQQQQTPAATSAADITALLSAIPRDTLLAALGIRETSDQQQQREDTRQQQQQTPAPAAPAAPRGKVSSTRKPRKVSSSTTRTSSATSAESLLGV